MGFRFHKSIKVAPGLKVNLNKKGVSVTGGVKGAHYTVSSSGKRTVSAGIPGSGLSYTKTTGSKSSPGHRTANSTPSKNSGNSGSCLMTCLKILGLLILIPFVLLFAWIPGIIWIIFFRGKMRNEPDRQKKYTIIISAASVISLLILIFSILFSPPSPTSLMLTPNYEGLVLDVNSDYLITVNCEPENASLSSVIYNIDQPTLASIDTSSDSPSVIVLHTTDEGTINITAEAGDIESNTLTFDIIDIDKQEKENAKNETESSANAEIQTEPTDTDTETETVEKSEDESPGVITDESVGTVVPLPESQVDAETIKPESSSDLTADSVWVSETGSKYHKINNCGKMNPDKAQQIPLQNAIDRGLEQCDKCF